MKVVLLPVDKRAAYDDVVPVELVLGSANEAKLERVAVIGIDDKGQLYVAGSHNEHQTAALIEIAKRWLLDYQALAMGLNDD